MILFPAIDIQEGNVVRLRRGDFSQVTTYARDPLAVAKQFEDAGAQWLHIIDLDGAKSGERRNHDVISAIARSVSIPVQTGGGFRSLEDIHSSLDAGIKRVILSTKAVEDVSFLKSVLARWPDQIAISLDCQNGKVAGHGWQKVSELKAEDVIKNLEQMGLRCLIFTDISRDGMLTGPNIESIMNILTASSIPLIASGGVASLNDLKALMPLTRKGLIGAIVGRALYEGALPIQEALKACSQNA